MHPSQTIRATCAVNCCRQPSAFTLTDGKVTLTLCLGHARTYRGLGYKDVE